MGVGTSTLPWLCEWKHDTTADEVAELRAYLEKNARQVKKRGSRGHLPLHVAASNQKGEHALSVVALLLEAFPEAAMEKNNDGWLPLHYAAANQRGEHAVKVVELLLTAFLPAASEKDNSGNLPLHCAAMGQSGEPGLAVLTALLKAHPLGAQQENNLGQLPLAVAQQHNLFLPAACIQLLKEAATDMWQPPPEAPDTHPIKLRSAYAMLTTEPDAAEFSSQTTPVTTLSIAQLELLSRRARVLKQLCNRSAEPLASLAAAAAALHAEERLPSVAALLLDAGPLLYELLTAAQTPHTPAPVLYHLQALCTAAEDAAAHLRSCHGELMAAVFTDPPPHAVDVTLINARNAALAAAQAASHNFSDALRATDMDAIAAESQAATDTVMALLHKVKEVTGAFAAEEGISATDGAVSADLSDATSQILKTAMTQLDSFTSSVASAIARLSHLDTVTLSSLGRKDTSSVRRAIETMRELTHDLLLATKGTSLSHYLALNAPWETACSALARRSVVLNAESNAIGELVSKAGQLSRETEAWTTAFAEREAKEERLEEAHRALRLARREMHRIKANDDSDIDEPENETETMRAAKRACRCASLERDAAADDLLALTLAYYPEMRVMQRKRLAPGGLPTVVSQRSREDYDNIEPLLRAGNSRHQVLRAKFDGIDCVLKVVAIADGRSLAREASILKQVQHPNIVSLEAVFVENDNAYLHMAYASHGDLEQFLAIEAVAASTGAGVDALPPRQLQRMARQLCEAVAYLAERSIVHCDIKPANVFVDGNRNNDTLHVLLGDFDVSHTATGRTTTLTRAVGAVATHYTPGFAPPEVLHAPLGNPCRVSPAIDVYGLGCVVFAMHMFPRTLPEPTSLDDAVSADALLFSPEPLERVATPTTAGWAVEGTPPGVKAWAATVPVDVVRRATCPQPRARASARELLHTHYMLEASGSFASASADVQRPAYWLHQSHTGSWLEDEPEEVRAAVEKVFNATAEPSSHGMGRDSHREPFERFKVTRVRRLEHPAVWSSYAGQRRHLADMLMAEDYETDAGIRPLATEKGGFVFPLEGGSLDKAAGEVFLFHGTGRPESIANSGFDVRYAFAGAGAGGMFGRGVYFSESASKADQYVYSSTGTGPLTMVLARVLLGRTNLVASTRSRAPFLPEVVDKSTADVPVYYDSIVADMRPQGMRFREIVVGDGTRAYPELFVEYERV